MARDFVTPEQIEAAREIDLVDYLHRTEPNNIVPSAPGEYRLKDHDSLKISKGKFHWFSRGVGGTNAIDYLVKVRGFDFKEAVRELARDYFFLDESEKKNDRSPSEAKASPSKQSKSKQSKSKQSKKHDYIVFFELPKANDHNDDVIKYLKGRGIEESVIDTCIKGKLLYQSKAYRKPLYHIEDGEKKPLYRDVDGKSKHRYESVKGGCIFVGYDGSTPKFACERSIKSDFKKDVAGSIKAYSFCMPPIAEGSQAQSHDKHNTQHDSNPQQETKLQNEVNRLYVFEGPIDCLSHASISQIGGTDWDGYRLSLGGISPKALNTFLENNPHINQVYLCLDNDERGKEAAENISNELLANEDYSHINIYIAPPPEGTGKDFNDTLLFMREKIKEKPLQVDIGVTVAAQKSDVDKVPKANEKPDVSRKRSDTAL